MLFLGFVVLVGAVLGHAIDAAGLALFFLFISSIEAKPSWKFHFDKPGDVDSGRSTMLNSWQRVGVTSPKELAKLPSIRD
ncbi:hypothetical protein BH18ACT12_BH18ACT12_06550 [soil metagenome]